MSQKDFTAFPQNSGSRERIGSVGVTRAAEFLTALGDPVERSTLSRYVSRYADALKPSRRGRETVVDFELLQQHRRENIRAENS